jgi:hypothetical protein
MSEDVGVYMTGLPRPSTTSPRCGATESLQMPTWRAAPKSDGSGSAMWRQGGRLGVWTAFSTTTS